MTVAASPALSSHVAPSDFIAANNDASSSNINKPFGSSLGGGAGGFLTQPLAVASSGDNESLFRFIHPFYDENEKSSHTTFLSNKICTSKYTWYNFLPRCLLQEFRRLANVYFLAIAILQSIRVLSPLTPFTAIAPLVAVVSVSLLREALEDKKRRDMDRLVNEKSVKLYRNHHEIRTTWESIEVGDILRINERESIPADGILLSSCEEDGSCFIDTSNLDGEANLKARQAIPAMAQQRDFSDRTLAQSLSLKCEPPSQELYKFSGNLIFDGHAYGLNTKQFLLRGSTLMNTKWIRMLVIYTGHETRIMMNARDAHHKMSHVEHLMSKTVALVFLLQVILCLISAILHQVWGQDEALLRANYMGDIFQTEKDFAHMILNFLSFVVLLNTLIPISLVVTIELVKIIHARYISWDDQMRNEAGEGAFANTSSLTDELGQVQYFFTDKTGTLTLNQMEFRKCSVDGKVYCMAEKERKTATQRMLSISRAGRANSGVFHDSMTEQAPLHNGNTNAHSTLSGNLSGNAEANALGGNQNRGVSSTSSLSKYGTARFGQPSQQQQQPSPSAANEVNSNSTGRGTGGISIVRPIQDDTTPETAATTPETALVPEAPPSAIAAAPSTIAGATNGAVRTNSMMSNQGSTSNNTNNSANNSRTLSYFQRLISNVEGKESRLAHAMALCHTVVCEHSEGTKEVIYNSDSPDESALVRGACAMGVKLLARNTQQVVLQVTEEGREKSVLKHVTYQCCFEILRVLHFSSDRKKMSVVVRTPDNTIKLLCKGADTVILPCCEEFLSPRQETLDHVQQFAIEGFRILLFAERTLTQEYYEGWEARYHEAELNIHGKEAKLEALCEEIENKLTLIGATAVEDKLQDGVPETIALLQKAGIKIWVLTGDKLETSLEMGKLCGVVAQDMKICLLQANDPESMRIQLANALAKNETQALAIEGSSLTYALLPANCNEFLRLALSCATVIVCRTSPIQKALVVELVKAGVSAITLAIGDGANDVSMIRAAHVGIGVAGSEGMQAVRSSDYAIQQFSHVGRLLLHHGRLSYMRTAECINYFFYKNIVFTLPQFIFGPRSLYSAQTFYCDLYISAYNMVFTAMPVAARAIMEMDLPEKLAEAFPELYRSGAADEYFSMKSVFKASVWAVAHAVVLTLLPLFIFNGLGSLQNGSPGDLWITSVASYFYIVPVVHFQIFIETWNWTRFVAVVYFASLLFFVISVAIYNQFNSVIYGVWSEDVVLPQFWLGFVLCSAICIFPWLAFKCYQENFVTTHPVHILRRVRFFHKIIDAGQLDTCPPGLDASTSPTDRKPK